MDTLEITYRGTLIQLADIDIDNVGKETAAIASMLKEYGVKNVGILIYDTDDMESYIEEDDEDDEDEDEVQGK